jgi:hypothetical protein
MILSGVNIRVFPSFEQDSGANLTATSLMSAPEPAQWLNYRKEQNPYSVASFEIANIRRPAAN